MSEGKSKRPGKPGSGGATAAKKGRPRGKAAGGGSLTSKDGEAGGSSFQLRLGELIRELKQKHGGYLPLETALWQDLGLDKNDKSLLSRRQLKKIAENEEIPLRLDQLELLERFLHRGQKSLAEVFHPPSLLRLMAEEGRIAFIIGSKPDHEDKRIDLSRWDIKSFQVILKAIHATGKLVQTSIEDVILRGKDDAKLFRAGGTVPSNEDWYNLVGDLDAPGESLIVLGSPRANHGSEVVLAKMLGVRPFEPWPRDTLETRPFAFFWPDWHPELDRPESCISYDPETDQERSRDHLDENSKAVLEAMEKLQIECLAKAARQKKGEAAAPSAQRLDCAVMAGGTLYPIQRQKGEEKSYAIIAARRGAYRTCVCICGATGPATLAAARAFERVIPGPDWGRKDKRVAWWVVRATVKDDSVFEKQKFRADVRRVVGEGIVDVRPHYYPLERW